MYLACEDLLSGVFPPFYCEYSVVHRGYLPKTGKFLNGKISNDDASKLYNEKLPINLISTFLLLNLVSF